MKLLLKQLDPSANSSQAFFKSVFFSAENSPQSHAQGTANYHGFSSSYQATKPYMSSGPPFERPQWQKI